MRRKLFGFSMLASVGLLSFAVVSCGSEISYASVSLNKTKLDLKISDDGFKLVLSATKGFSGDPYWVSSNESVAYVRDDGFVFPVGLGSATVSAFYGGGRATCAVTVSEGEGGGGEQKDRLVISPQSVTLKPGDTQQLSVASVYPEDTIVSFSSTEPTIVTVTTEGLMTAVSKGTTTVVASGNNGKVDKCVVTVSEEGGSKTDLDPAVGTDLKYNTALRIGAPLNQIDWMKGILNEFNKLTNSTISFTVEQFEESNGTSGVDSPAKLPAVWPYASDQTADFHEIKALAAISPSDASWIKKNMGDKAYTASRLGTSVVGYPFTSDNGSVMFYDKSAVSAEEIDSISKLEAKAAALGREVDLGYGNAFYSAGILQTFAKDGQSMYSLSPTDNGYTSTGSFTCAEGIKGAKLLRHFIEKTDIYRNAATAPSKTGKKVVLATIVDVSNVALFKEQMGNKYETAPLPMVDLPEFIGEGDPVRLGSYLGYKFYGVNKSLSAANQKAAADVAKFLSSEYVQAKRFDKYQAKPSLNSLQEYASGESHVKSLSIQADQTILLSAIGSEFYSSIGTAYTAIKNFKGTPTDADYENVLKLLDSGITKK